MINSGRFATSESRCGHIAIAGRPNVGKSTLLNTLVGVKISAIADKPQTTWHNILGVLTEHDTQMVFVDTPGMHLGKRKLLNQFLNDNARSAISNVNMILYMVDTAYLDSDDEFVLSLIKESGKACILCINKTDLYQQKSSLLPVIERLSKLYSFNDIVPISAKKGTNLDVLKKLLRQYLPISEFQYPKDQISDRSTRFFVAEFIREQLVRHMGDELPYSVFVEIEKYEEQSERVMVSAIIWVSRVSQKGIVIGRHGAMLKGIGIKARRSIEDLVSKKVYLKLWVKNKEDWQNDPKVIASFDSSF